MATSPPSSLPSGLPSSGRKLLDRLRDERRVDQFEYARVLEHAQRYGQRVEDSLIDTETMPEVELLRYLAQRFRTRFVSANKLAKAPVAPAVLRLVPEPLASRIGVCPILFDQRTETLSLVAADLESFDVERQVRLVSGVRTVRAYVARPAAVEAAIAKHYRGDFAAFDRLDERRETPTSMSPDDYVTIDDLRFSDQEPLALPDPSLERRPIDRRPSPFVPERDSDIRITEVPIPAVPNVPALVSASARSLEPPAFRPPVVTPEDYLETMNVLVSLLELERDELRGHTSRVARLCRKLCERIGLDEEVTHGTLVAAYLHDVGKVSSYHLTALNVAEYDGHRVQARKSYLAPARLLESVRMPSSAIRAWTHMYERFDGEGFPDALVGNDIPLSARMLAVTETFVDLTQNARNPYRKRLSAKQALRVLEQFKETIFDPTLVDVLRLLVLGDEVKAKLLADDRLVLIMEPNPEEATVLEMRLIEQGYRVVVARSAVDGMDRVAEGGIHLIVAEVELSPVDGFQFIEQLREDGLEVPVIFTTKRGDRASVNRGFEVGAVDYIVKPAPVDVVVAKISQVLSKEKKPGRGVSGSLREMALSDVIQVLAHGRKTGRLTVRSGGQTGEVEFAEGQIYASRFGTDEGVDAFCKLMAAIDGEFVLDPSYQPTRRNIHESPEGLLLEAMRRIDERLV